MEETIIWRGFNNNSRTMHDFLGGNPNKPMVTENENFRIDHSERVPKLILKTMNGEVTVEVGDLVVKSPKGYKIKL